MLRWHVDCEVRSHLAQQFDLANKSVFKECSSDVLIHEK